MVEKKAAKMAVMMDGMKAGSSVDHLVG